MLVAGHLMHTYLALTTNWIYAHLSRMQRWTPAVAALHSANRNAFPLARVATLADMSSARQRWNQAGWLLRGYYPFQREALHDARLLHAHFGDQGWAALALRQRLRVPLITTFYGYDISKYGILPMWRERYRELFAEGSCFLVEGSHMARCLVALGCPPAKVRVQRLGVDLQALAERAAPPPIRERIELLTAASFRAKKGLPDALAAFIAAHRREPRLRWTLIGDANPDNPEEVAIKAQLVAMIEAAGVGAHVRLLGYQPLQRFRAELAQAHLFLHPSVTAPDGDTEGGAPVAIIEAQALGVPVIATFHADIPEVVQDGVAGLLVPEHDVAGLTERVLALAGAPERWPAMGAAGRAHIVAHYDLAQQAARLETIYDEVAGAG